MPSSVNLGRFNRAFERLFNTKGGQAVSDVAPSLGLEYSLPFSLEERFLFGVESFAAAGAQAAVAANKSAFMIRNPTGSGVIATIEKIVVSSTASEQFLLAVAGSNPADLATAVANNTRADPRSRSHGSCLVSQDAPAADPGTGFLNTALEAATSVEFILYQNQEIVLLPQIAMRVIGQTVNQSLIWTVWWRERPLEQSELA